MIFSNLIYSAHSSTFSGFVDIIFISFFIFVISLLFGLTFIISIWEPCSFLEIFEIISSLDFVIWLSCGSCWISISINIGFLSIILNCSFLLIVLFIFIYWDIEIFLLFFVVLCLLYLISLAGWIYNYFLFLYNFSLLFLILY